MRTWPFFALAALLLLGSAASALDQPAQPSPTAPPQVEPPRPPATVQTVPITPPPAVDIVREARSLGRSPADFEIEEVTLDSVQTVAMSLDGTTDQLPSLIPAAIGGMTTKLTAAGVKPAGPPMMLFLSLEDGKFTAQLMMPLLETPSAVPEGLKLMRSPAGTAVRIVHEGPYSTIGQTYDQLSAFLEDRDIEVQDIVIERYMRDPTTADEDLVVEIIVPQK